MTALRSLFLAIALLALSGAHARAQCPACEAQGAAVAIAAPAGLGGTTFGAPAAQPGSPGDLRNVVLPRPYSYYLAAPLPARYYVGYGTNDFPFYGSPYGSVNDRWNFYHMGDPLRGLARYYYPPVP